MSKYSQIRPQIYSGSTGKWLRELTQEDPALGRLCRTLQHYLLCNEHAHYSGIYHLELWIIAGELGESVDEVRRGLRTLEGGLKGASTPLVGGLDAPSEGLLGGFAYYDEQLELVYVPNMAKEQTGRKPLNPRDNRNKGLFRRLQGFDGHRFAVDFATRYRSYFHLDAQQEDKPPSSPLGPPSKGASSPRVAVADAVADEKEETRATLGQQLLEQGGPNFSAEELLGVRTQLMREGWSEGFQLRLGRAPTAPLHPHVAQQLAQGPWSKMELAFSVANWIHKGDPEQRRNPFDFLRESEHWYRLGCIALERHEAKQAGGGA